MNSKPFGSEQGLALVIVLIMMVCFTIIAVAFFSLYNRRLAMNTSYIGEYSPQYVADVGLKRYLWVLNNNPYNVTNFVNSTKINGRYIYTGYNKEVNGYYAIECTTTPAANASPSSLNLTCTGWLASDPSNRYSITATVQVRSFCQYLYLTDQETEPGGTTPVYWGPDDILHGSLFTNGYIHTKNDKNTTLHKPPLFEGLVYYHGNTSDQLSSDAIMDYPDSNVLNNEFPYCSDHKPIYADSAITFPNKVDNMKTIAEGQGYYFQGRTCIWLHGNQMDVENGGSKTTKSLPTNGVIYVDGATSSADPTKPDAYNPGDKFNTNYGNVFVYGTLSGQLTIYAANNIYLTAGNPTSAPPASNTSTTHNTNNLVTYASTSWSSNSDPTLGDSVTATATNAPAGISAPSTDMLGLVADNYVMILRYGWPTAGGYGVDDSTHTYEDYSPSDNPEIDAAIMSLNHSLLYECYWPSPATWSTQNCDESGGYVPTTLTIRGAIIQKYRGAISGGDIYTGASGFSTPQMGCGYKKNYWFDARMQSEMPPFFLLPGNSGWGILTWSMITPPDYAILDTRIYVPAQSITVSTAPGVTSVATGETLQLTATVNPNNEDQIAPQTVIWSFSDGKTTDTTTGSRIDPYTGILTAGATTGLITVRAMANGSTVTGTATINIT